MTTLIKITVCIAFMAALVAPVHFNPVLPMLDGPSIAEAAKKSSSSTKTQGVSSYTKKNGTKVKSYKRTPPR